MKKGYRFDIVTCPDCGEGIPFNWLIRHRNAEHPVEAEMQYEWLSDLVDDFDFFDYEYLPKCQYPVADPSSPEGEFDCGAAAVVVGWWRLDGEGNPVEPWYLCEEHLMHIVRCEREYMAGELGLEAGR